MIKIVLISTALVIGAYDYKYNKIKNVLLMVILVFAFFLPASAFTETFNYLPLIMLMVMWISYENKWLGAGDIKYLFVTGLCFEIELCMWFYLITFALGGLYAAMVIGLNKVKHFEPPIKCIPYGVPISLVFVMMLIRGV